jgi:hypothetical protein
MRNKRPLSLVAMFFLLVTASGTAAAQTSGLAVNHVAVDVAVSDITLVRASDTTAVIRSNAGALHIVKLADLIGAAKAVVKEITPGRLVLEEIFTGKDGKPNRASIVIKEGERGGSRYLQRADEPPLTGTKPLIVPITPAATTPAPKKPPRM